MNLRFYQHTLPVLLVALLLSGVFAPTQIQAQDTITITLVVPRFWEDLITDEMLADFEAIHPDISVRLVTNDAGVFGGGGSAEDQLDNTEEYVRAGDVLLVGSSSLNSLGTLAGYFLNLTPLVSSDPHMNPADFLPSVWQSFQWDGGLWALPISTNVNTVSYNQSAFDLVGLAYPSGSWTLDDFANAARTLTQYGEDGQIDVPGMFVGDEALFFRSLLSQGLYDNTVIPNAPSLANNSELVAMLTTWADLLDEGVVSNQFSENTFDIPLSIGGGFVSFRAGPGGDDTEEPIQTFLPNNQAGLNVQAFAMSSGTRYPEQAYALLKFLTERPEVANNFFGIRPARINMPEASTATGPGGFIIEQAMSESLAAILDQALANGIPTSELRYTSYISDALSAMLQDGLDAQTALNDAEVAAINDNQLALDRASNTAISVATPPPPIALAPGETSLNFGVGAGFGGGGGGIIVIGGGNDELPNQQAWDQVFDEFINNDPQVGQIIAEQSNSDFSEMAATYDCFVVSYNAVPVNDLSGVLNLDPFMDTDVNFDRNDVLGNTMAQLQQDNRTYALPLSIQPQIIRYDPEAFAQAGVPEPLNGWTTDSFIDALRRLKPSPDDAAPFVPNGFGDAYIMMLIAAFGGNPIDSSTTPSTINFTDPQTVEAIQQVLNLAKGGYIEYSELSGNDFFIGGNVNETPPAITVDTLGTLSFRRLFGNGQADPTRVASFPIGSHGGVASYEITTGYISATSENPEACYRLLSEITRHPEVFSGMPALSSVANDPVLIASQGEDMAALFNQFQALLQDPNTLIFPSNFRRGGSPASFAESYWLNRVLDRYVLEDADLELELAEAQLFTLAYQVCTANIPPLDLGNVDNQQEIQDYFEQIQGCATQVDPTYAQ